ncbi:MAG: helix-turn-helix transcriptional regulator [Chloroflexota bacterium]
MRVQTRIFDLCGKEYKNLSELASAMGISVSQIYRVRQGKRNINQKFIVGALQAFPGHKLDDLFYLTPTSQTNNHECHENMIIPVLNRQRPKGNHHSDAELITRQLPA